MVISDPQLPASGFWKRAFRKVFGAGLPAVALVVLSAPSVLPAARATLPSVVTGKVRVQLLSDSLVRIELKGPAGFEDRETFHIVNRDWPGVNYTETNWQTDAIFKEF